MVCKTIGDRRKRTFNQANIFTFSLSTVMTIAQLVTDMEHIKAAGAYPLHFFFSTMQTGKDKEKMSTANISHLVQTIRNIQGSARVYTTQSPQCTSTGERRCEDGTCISRVELCPEEQLMNQNTILIMIVVGLAVVIFLVILYCFQQRQQRANNALGTDTAISEDCDNASLYAPPPSYEDVMSSNLYLPTSEHRRMLSSVDEPLTPPPNYDTALILLAQSQESALNKPQRQSSVFRRSVSMENANGDETQDRNSLSHQSEIKNSKNGKNKDKQTFRFSGHFVRTYVSSGNNQNQSAQWRSSRRTSLPPYSPPVYPITPPPPITPIPTPTSVQSQLIMSDLGQPTIQESSNEGDVV